VWVLIAVAAGLIAGPRLWPASTATKVTYTEFLDLVQSGKVDSVEINNLSNTISGKMADGSEFTTTGAAALSDADEQLLKEKGVDYDYSTPQGNFSSVFPHHGILHLDATTRNGPSRKYHVDWPQSRKELQRRQTKHHVCRCCWL
jgi:ATP-dependent Zn protease